MEAQQEVTFMVPMGTASVSANVLSLAQIHRPWGGWSLVPRPLPSRPPRWRLAAAARRATLCGVLLAVTACSTRPTPLPPSDPLVTGAQGAVALGGQPQVEESLVRSGHGEQPGSFSLDPGRVAQLDEILSRMAADETFSGSALIAQDGEVLLSRGYGSADRELGISNTTQTRFRLGSVTKQFTAMAILILQSQGRLNVQDRICRYVEDCPAAWEDITIHHLLTHTSGITYMVGNPGSLPITPAELVALFKESSLDFQPGGRYSYSNCGYWVLGAIIERVSGQSYEDFIQQAIFEPLDMHDSGYDQDASGLAVGYVDQDTAAPAEVIDSSFPYSAGALYSTVEDLYRWDQALYTDSLIPRGLLDQMFRPRVVVYPDVAGSMAYGYGWQVQDDLGRPLVYHVGAIEGFRAGIFRYPGERITIILLSNQEDSPDTISFSWRFLNYETVAIETEDGTTITYAGALEVQAGGMLAASFMVTGPNGQPAQGQLVGMLGESPTDSAAIRASQSLSTDGIAELVWPVNLPAGTTRLYCGLGGVDYEVVRITISP
jgi:CubicO group peptidase (beta-lactamase class C family)